MQPAILWFRRNLRLSDNAALIAAAQSGRPIIPLYIIDEQDKGGASRWWLHHSLVSLDRGLQKLGSSLVVRCGSPSNVLAEMVARSGANALYYSRRYEPVSRRQEIAVDAALGGSAEVHALQDSLLCNPETVMTRTGTTYRVFTPFWKSASESGDPPLPRPTPVSINFEQKLPESLQLADAGLLPTPADWTSGLHADWAPGEAAALVRLDDLASTLEHYDEHRDRPDLDATSRLSPSLHFGEVSVRQIWHEVRRLEPQLPSTSGCTALLRQLYWRDFSSYLLFHFPDLPDKPLRNEFEQFPRSENESDLRAWQRGLTGYPIVDAGMRQLRQTGWMHNRVRMIAASFLVKDLLIPWQTGAAWFLDNLVDADLANNSASWQWVAGCGSDAAPYFRIFNPELQAKNFDPLSRYVRHWLPELGGSANAEYPAPIVDHGAARQRALAAFQSVKGIRTSKLAP